MHFGGEDNRQKNMPCVTTWLFILWLAFAKALPVREQQLACKLPGDHVSVVVTPFNQHPDTLGWVTEPRGVAELQLAALCPSHDRNWTLSCGWLPETRPVSPVCPEPVLLYRSRQACGVRDARCRWDSGADSGPLAIPSGQLGDAHTLVLPASAGGQGPLVSGGRLHLVFAKQGPARRYLQEPSPECDSQSGLAYDSVNKSCHCIDDSPMRTTVVGGDKLNYCSSDASYMMHAMLGSRFAILLLVMMGITCSAGVYSGLYMPKLNPELDFLSLVPATHPPTRGSEALTAGQISLGKVGPSVVQQGGAEAPRRSMSAQPPRPISPSAPKRIASGSPRISGSARASMQQRDTRDQRR